MECLCFSLRLFQEAVVERKVLSSSSPTLHLVITFILHCTPSLQLGLLMRDHLTPADSSSLSSSVVLLFVKTSLLETQEHILGLDDGSARFCKEVNALSNAFALSISGEEAVSLKEEVAFFQAVIASLAKFEGSGEGGKSDVELESAIRQIIDEIKARTKRNALQSKKLSEMLGNTIRKYQNNVLTAAEVIEELILHAKEIKYFDKESQERGLTDFEYSFYMALADNGKAREFMEKEYLKDLAIVVVNVA